MSMQLDTENARKFNASLKAAISNKIGQKVKVEIINSYKFPNCYVRVHPETKFENDFRLKVYDACHQTREGLLNADDVSYGTIQSNSISAKVFQWVNLFDKE